MFVSGAFVLTDTLGRSFDNALRRRATPSTDVRSPPSRRSTVGELEGEQVAGTAARRRPSTRSRRCPGWPRPPAWSQRRRRPGDRQQRQGGHHRSARRGSAATGPARTACCSCARAAARRADDEIAINAGLAKAGRRQGRRPGRRAHPAAEEDVHARRHLRLQRRPGLPRRRAARSRSPSRSRSS